MDIVASILAKVIMPAPKEVEAFIAPTSTTRSPAHSPREVTEIASERERLLNDAMNTGVSAALIGGFALGNLSPKVEAPGESGGYLDLAAYMLSFISVHACTCSCLTSGMLYRQVNMLSEEAAAGFETRHSLLLMLPWMKFAMGVSAYIASVIILSLIALEDIPLFQSAALAIGLMSMSTVVATAAVLQFTPQPKRAML